MNEDIAQVFQDQEDKIDRLLIDTRDKLRSAVIQNSRDLSRFDRIAAILIAAFVVNLRDIVISANRNLVDAVSNVSQDEATKYLKQFGSASSVLLSKSVKDARDFSDSFSGDIFQRKIGGRTIEYRIGTIRSGATKTVRNIISVGIRDGKSVPQIAQDIETYIRPEDKLSRISPLEWYRKRFAAYRVKDLASIPSGSLSYNALVIARTETNRTYRDSVVELNDGKPWIYGYQWNLSRGHPAPDICDVWAEQDNGMGPGIYDSRNLPDDHPNGICFVTPVVVSREEFSRYLKFGEDPTLPPFKGDSVIMQDWLDAKRGNSAQVAVDKLLGREAPK